jgi:hypothetical protein
MGEEQTKQRRGCLFYGCIVAAVLMALALVGALVGYRYAKKMVRDFTEPAPMVLPTVQMAPADLDKLQLRVEQFREAVRQGDSVPPPLTLNSTEINALIATDPDLSALKRKLFVTLTNSQVKGLLSIPMEQVGLPMFKGRYLNGEGMFTISFRNGHLYINAMKLTVKGRVIPEPYMDKIRQQNLAENMNQDPRGKAALSRLKDIQVKDDQLMIVPKGSGKP